MISEVFNMDCTDGMKQYPDKYFDLAVVDPPYGINRSGQRETFTKIKRHKRKYFEDKKWDRIRPDLLYWSELFRISKNQVVWGANYFTNYLPPSKGWIFWDKGQDLTMSDGELAYTSFDKALRRIIINRGVLTAEGGTIHPTQKPIKLYDWIYAKYLPQGGKVIDTHLGSGSNRIAAFKAGNIDFTGYELDKDYFEAERKRFNQYTEQLRIAI